MPPGTTSPPGGCPATSSPPSGHAPPICPAGAGGAPAAGSIHWPPGGPTWSCGCTRSPTPGCPGPRSPHYDAVASLYRLAYEEELVAANPCARVARPKIHRELQRREVLTVLEYAAFLTTARHLTPSHHAIAVLGGMMGLRATEMATLAVESFGTVRGYATLIVVGKGDKPVRVPVPIPALGAVQAALDGRTTG